MEDERLLKIRNLDNAKLIDIVKNYKQYDYPSEFRSEALKILAERGITNNALKISGNLDNNKYDNAEQIFKKFTQNNNIALFFYFASGLAYISNNMALGFILSLLFLGVMIFVFSNRNDFYRAIKEDDKDFSTTLFVFVGIPFYFFIYFMTKNEMKEKLNKLL